MAYQYGPGANECASADTTRNEDIGVRRVSVFRLLSHKKLPWKGEGGKGHTCKNSAFITHSAMDIIINASRDGRVICTGVGKEHPLQKYRL